MMSCENRPAEVRGVEMILATALSVSLSVLNLLGQAPPAGTLRITVVDPSGAVIVGATVTVTGAEESPSGTSLSPVKTSDTGVTSITGLAQGRYTVPAEFP